MQPDEITALFDQQASSYDERWARTAAIREALYLLMGAVFSPLPAQAHILCVGAGTGEEIGWMARRFPGWHFLAVEPSGAMLAVCRDKLEREGFGPRCEFHEGDLASLPARSGFDAATCLLVSQFILDREARVGFFRGIADRLKDGGLLVSSDLAAPADPAAFEAQLQLWLDMLRSAGIAAAGLEQMRAAYCRDVAVLPPHEVGSIIAAGGFEQPLKFYQAGLIQAWSARRAPVPAASRA